MTLQTNFPMNDLVLRLAGGQRDGELIPVKTHKCFLGFEENSTAGVVEQPQCAIYRGPNGAAVRSYCDQLSINGVAATVHWLKEGDRIEFPNAMTVEVTQLGWVDTECEELHTVQEQKVECDPESDPLDEQESCQPQGEDQIESHGVDHPPSTEIEQESEPEMVAKEHQPSSEIERFNRDDSRIEKIESQIKEVQSQSCQTQQRFDQLEAQIVTLSDHISQLVSDGQAGEPEVGAESFMTFGNDEPSVEEPSIEAQSTHEAFMHEATPDANEGTTADGETDYQALGDFYSHHDDDDEKIMSFDPESDVAEVAETPDANIEITDAQPELNSVEQSEIDSRLSEMERVFGGSLAKPDPEVTETAADQTANEQPVDSFETPTHGLDEGSDSFADFTATGASEPVQPGSLASQILSEVMSDEDHVESVIEESVDETESVDVTEAVDETDSVEEPAEESSSSQSSSVADLLARMKADGQWDGIPDGDEPVEPVVETTLIEALVESNESEVPEDDVQDYMSQLLNRMRGDEPPPKPKPAVKKAPKETKKKEAPKAEEFVEPANPLKPEEFKPSQKAQRIELGAMRELANSTSRHAVHASEQGKLKELGYLQVGIAVCSFFMALYYFFWDSQVIMDTGFLLGFVCVGISGFLGYRFYSTMKFNESTESSAQSGSGTNSKEAEVSDEPVAEPAAE